MLVSLSLIHGITYSFSVLILLHWRKVKKNPCEYNLFLFPPLVPGHYVPQLARKIVGYNKVSPYPFINLKESLWVSWNMNRLWNYAALNLLFSSKCEFLWNKLKYASPVPGRQCSHRQLLRQHRHCTKLSIGEEMGCSYFILLPLSSTPLQLRALTEYLVGSRNRWVC